MALVATRAAVDGPHAPLLLPTSLAAEPGAVTFVMADPGPSSTTLSLALGGRIRLDGGRITLDGDDARAARRARVALVDVPGVSEPDGGLPVHVVLGEELAFAGLPARRADVAAFLETRDAASYARDRWETLPPEVRTRWLCALAARRPEVDVVVMTGPDRQGGDPRRWYATAADLADEGFTVVVLATHASAHLLGRSHGEHTFEAGVA